MGCSSSVEGIALPVSGSVSISPEETDDAGSSGSVSASEEEAQPEKKDRIRVQHNKRIPKAYFFLLCMDSHPLHNPGLAHIGQHLHRGRVVMVEEQALALIQCADRVHFSIA